MNTERANNGTELYTSKLFELTDTYIGERFGSDEEKVNSHFRDLIFYLSDRLQKIPNEEIEELDAMFEAYVRLCAKYGKLPTVELFAMLAKINPATLTDWKNGEYRSSTAHGKTVKKWLETCRSFVVDELSNSRMPNPNLIFTAKAAYYMRETAPIPAEPQSRLAAQTPEEIAQRYGISYKSDCKIDFPEVPD